MHDNTACWSVAIIASRESSSTLGNCIQSVLDACASRHVVIDVLVNGNHVLAEEVSILFDKKSLGSSNALLRIWSIAIGDKAFTWNEYLHRLWPAGTTAFFIDGYVQVRPDAFAALERSLLAHPGALGATGVPTSGRSAPTLREQMLRSGGFHGNMHVLRAESMTRLRELNFRLPKGLYRTDSLIGAMLMFSFDASTNGWNTERIAVVADATWEVPGIAALTLRNVISQLKRMVRQAQGELENRAVREHLVVLQRPAQDLPEDAQSLVNGWLARNTVQTRSLFLKRPLCRYAAYKLRTPRDWSAASKAPVLVCALGASTAVAPYIPA